MSFLAPLDAVRRGWQGAARVVGRYYTVISVLGAALAIYAAALESAGVVVAESTTTVATAHSRPQLRVCADPNNLPYSNDRLEGFENALASLIARELQADVSYTWWAQRGGFIRNTLNAGECDVLIGVPSFLEMVLTTRPYYRSTYVFVSRADKPWRVESFDDPLLRELTIGVQIIGDDFANAPPGHALSARGIVTNVRGYSVYGDYREDAPSSRIIEAVASGEIDVAVAWGPLAGFFAMSQGVELVLHPVSPQIDLPFLPMVFDVSMGVRRGDKELRDRLDAVLTAREAEIDALLERFSVPRLMVSQGRAAAALQ